MKKGKYIIPGNLAPVGFLPESSNNQDFNFPVIDQCIDVIQLRFDPIKSMNRNLSSYGLKHILERHIGTYVSNGDIIVAMLTCGYRHFPIKNTPNCHFNVSQSGVKLLRSLNNNS